MIFNTYAYGSMYYFRSINISEMEKKNAKLFIKISMQVCHSWNRRCSSPALWEIKTLQNRVCELSYMWALHHCLLSNYCLLTIGLPMKSFVSWKQYFLDDLRLKRNWVKGKRVSNSLVGHTKRSVDNMSSHISNLTSLLSVTQF